MSLHAVPRRFARIAPHHERETTPRRAEATSVFQILTVTDHEMCRDWLAAIISRELDLAVCAEVGDLATAQALFKAQAPSLVILQSPLNGVHSYDAMKPFHGSFAKVPVLVIGDVVSGAHAEGAIRAGARGYIHRRESKLAVLSAIRRLLSGGMHLSESNADAMLRRMCSVETPRINYDSYDLSTREREVLTLLGSGFRPTDIANQLSVGVRTIESYTSRIRQKLDIATARELTVFAVAWMRGQPIA
jgi:DNA-binding NarL/FixJ family response regulator